MIDGIPPDGGDGTLVLDAIARQYGIRYADLRGRNIKWQFVHPRHEAMRVLYDGYGWSLARIRRLFGWGDRTTVLYGIRAARERRKRLISPEQRAAVESRVITRAASRQGVEVEEMMRRFCRKRALIARDAAMLSLHEKHEYTYRALARIFDVGTRAVSEALRRARHRRSTYGNKNSIIPSANLPIGTVKPGDPLYELDQQMLRARTMRHRAEGGWRQSSLADAA